MPKFPIRAGLLVPLLSLGLLVPSAVTSPTRADTLPTPCELTAAADPAGGADDDVLMLSAILSVDIVPAVAAAPPPGQGAPTPPGAPVPSGAPMPPGGIGAPKPPGTDLRPPDPALLNLEPIVAARQLRESLTEKQIADLRAVLTKHQDRLQQVRARPSEVPTEPQGNRPAKADREVNPNQTSADVQLIAEQIDQEIEPLLTPAQRALLQKARPKRLRAELPEEPGALVAGGESAC